MAGDFYSPLDIQAPGESNFEAEKQVEKEDDKVPGPQWLYGQKDNQNKTENEELFLFLWFYQEKEKNYFPS